MSTLRKEENKKISFIVTKNPKHNMAESLVSAFSSEQLKQVKEFDESKTGVKGLVDSGITAIPEFFVHPLESLCDLKTTSTTSKTVPLIDLSGFDSPIHRPNIINQIKEAATTWGLFQVINHGVSTESLNEITAAAKAFHEQPNEHKAKYYKREHEQTRGVVFCSNDALYQGAATWHDTLQIWNWPQRSKEEDIPEICRKELVSWQSYAAEVAEVLLGLSSEGLGLEATKLKDLTALESSLIMAHYYPRCPQPELTLGLHGHNDLGIITVLLQNQVPGLQVKHGGEWVDVKHVQDALVINMGDFTRIISNGEYISPRHRVLANSSEEPRVTIGAFYGVRGNWKDTTKHGPLREVLSPQKPPLYREFTLEEYLAKYQSSKEQTDNKDFSDQFKI